MLNTRDQIAEVLKTELSAECVFAYLFGSAATDKLTPESDIDIGVFLKTHPAKSYEIQATIATKLSDILSRDIDIIILNTSDPIITMQVIDGGFLIFTHDEVSGNKIQKRRSACKDFYCEKLLGIRSMPFCKRH